MITKKLLRSIEDFMSLVEPQQYTAEERLALWTVIRLEVLWYYAPINSSDFCLASDI